MARMAPDWSADPPAPRAMPMAMPPMMACTTPLTT